MDENYPKRPMTERDAALEALENFVTSEFALIIAERRDGLEMIDAARGGAEKGFTSDGPLNDPYRRQVADHLDYLYESVAVGARKLRALASRK